MPLRKFGRPPAAFRTLRSFLKGCMFRFVAVGLGIGLALAAAESFLRLCPRFGYDGAFGRVRMEEEGRRNLLWRKRHSSVLGFENIPNSQGTNAYAMPGREHPLAKPAGTLRILILGDSIAEAFDNDFFEDLLNAGAGPERGFEVWNGGVGAYDVRKYYLYLKHRGLRFRPDRVLLFLCLNDFELDTSVYYKDAGGVEQYDLYLSGAWFRDGVPSPVLMRYSRLYRLAVLRINKQLRRWRGERRHPQEEDGREYLRRIRDLCRERNIPLAAVLFPYLKPLQEYDGRQRLEYAAIQRALRDYGIRCVDLHGLLPQRELRGLRADPSDEIHPSRQTHRRIAKLLLKLKIADVP